MKDPNAILLCLLSTIDDISKDQITAIVLAPPLDTLKTSSIQQLASIATL